MSVQLLDKTRKIGQLLHNNNSSKVVFNDICSILTQILASNVLVISRKGKVLGVSEADQVSELKEMIVDRVGNFIDPMLNERFLSILSTKENVNLETLGFLDDNIRSYQAIVNPIEIAGERLGTVFMYRLDRPYEIDDIILSEYGTTVVGLEMDCGATLRFMLEAPLTVEGDIHIDGVALEADDHAAFKRSSGWKTILVAHGGGISGSPSVPGALVPPTAAVGTTVSQYAV